MLSTDLLLRPTFVATWSIVARLLYITMSFTLGYISSAVAWTEQHETFPIQVILYGSIPCLKNGARLITVPFEGVIFPIPIFRAFRNTVRCVLPLFFKIQPLHAAWCCFLSWEFPVCEVQRAPRSMEEEETAMWLAFMTCNTYRKLD